MGHLTEESVRQRPAELFPDGSGGLAVPPKLPPDLETANNELCVLALHIPRARVRPCARLFL